jgi:hypothetical protein
MTPLNYNYVLPQPRRKASGTVAKTHDETVKVVLRIKYNTHKQRSAAGMV